MRVGVIGSGYVGLVTGACLAKVGNYVTCIDIDEEKINSLKEAKIPIYEPGLDDIIKNAIKSKNIFFSTQIEDALKNSEIIFIAVGTPTNDDGSANLKYVFDVAKEIGAKMKKPLVVVDKSTVPVGTAKKVEEIILNELEKRGEKIEFDVVSNPEFLKEGAAIDDFLRPDRIIVGTNSNKAFELIKELYRPFMMSKNKLIKMDVKSAEMSKYAANSILATKISFINEIAMICERVGADINQVRLGIGSDSRIGYDFIYAGCGYGGSCFPKDVDALIYTAKENDFNPVMLNATKLRNELQKDVLFEKLKTYFGINLKNLTIAIWGLSFKPNTDDMREASSIKLINALANEGTRIKTYDPKAYKEAKIYFKDIKNITYEDDKYDALNGADALVLVTEWDEFRSIDFNKVKKLLKNSVIFDGRNQFDAKLLSDLGFDYFQIGVKNEKINNFNNTK